jgi:hypothetical protein
MNANVIGATKSSPIILISCSPKTPITSNVTQVNFYLPLPFSSSSSSSSHSSSSSSSAFSAKSTQNTPINTLLSDINRVYSPVVSQESCVKKTRVPSKFIIMSDDDSSSFEDVSDNENSLLDNDSITDGSTVGTSNDSTDLTNSDINLTEMAASLSIDNNTTFNFTKEEELGGMVRQRKVWR